MSFTKEEIDNVTMIKIDEERLDSILAPDLKTELLFLADNGITKILIDLTNVRYADSSGLGALLFGLRQLKNLGGQLKLLGANSKVMSLIKIARLEGHLHCFANKSEALISFKSD